MAIYDTKIAHSYLGGQLEVFIGDLVGESLLNDRAWARHELDWLQDVLECIKPKVCLDIGANIGSHTELFSRLCDQTFAFEPNINIFDVLQRNINRNGMKAKAFPVGLGDQQGECSFYIRTDGNLGNSSFLSQGVTGGFEVTQAKMEVGDQFLVANGIGKVDVIKIDAESYEANILYGLKNTIAHNKPLVFFEWYSKNSSTSFEKFRVFNEILDGYSFFAIQRKWTRELNRTPGKRLMRKFLRKFRRDIVLNTYIIDEFIPAREFYDLVMAVPPQHTELLQRFKGKEYCRK